MWCKSQNNDARLNLARLARHALVWLASVLASVTNTLSAAPAVESLAELRNLAADGKIHTATVNLNGEALWIAAGSRKFLLRDATGTESIDTDLPLEAIRPGHRVQIEGRAVVAESGIDLRLTAAPTVDNDGIHGMRPRSGAVYLEAGRQPLRVEWFNRTEQYGLEVELEGPGFARRRMSTDELSTASADGAGFQPGLHYRSFSGSWVEMPDLRDIAPKTQGMAPYFDLNKSDLGFAAMEFTGWFSAPQTGSYTFYLTSDDGSLLFVGPPPLALKSLESVPANNAGASAASDRFAKATVEGTVHFLAERSGSWELELESDDGRMLVEIAETGGILPESLWRRRVRVDGWRQKAADAHGREMPGRIYVQSARDLQRLDDSSAQESPVVTGSGAPRLALLITAEQVRRLRPAEAKLGYPVKLRGVITFGPVGESAVIQDSTSGIYFEYFDLFATSPGSRPTSGAAYEIEGVTAPGNFSPIVNARRITYLGPGFPPAPKTARWDQLMNGSLDSQYVEISGIVTAAHEQNVTLLTEGGSLQIEFDNLAAESLRHFQDGVIRIRGCLLALWDPATHQVVSGRVRVFNASVSLDEAPPADPFASERKSIAELRQFDAQAGVFQRVQVAGQIIHSQDGVWYLSDGADGLRFQLKDSAAPKLGDVVEVVGFPELGGASPILRAAVVRVTGRQPLPPGVRLSPGNLLSARYDATRVQIEAQLVDVHAAAGGEVAELKAESAVFTARCPSGSGGSLKLLPIGSLVDVAGIYVAHGGAPAGAVASFELLLNSAADLHILKRPPWWTPRRALGAVGALLVILLLATMWIATLRRRVEEKTGALQTEIEEHKRTESQLEKKSSLLQSEVEERKAIEAEMERVHKLLVEASRNAGMAEVATGVLHNIGNVLNGVNLSLTALTERVNASFARRLEGVVGLLRQNAGNLETFLSHDPKGKLIPEFLEKLVEQANAERAALLNECDALRKSLDHVNQVVAMQQYYATHVVGLEEAIDLPELVEEALRMTARDFQRSAVVVERSFDAVASIKADRHRVLQILVNLLKNAAKACARMERPDRKVSLSLAGDRETGVTLEVRDNGIGIPPENLGRIFGQGFTTDSDGRGFGLHSSALIARELGGKITVSSPGVGKGALFILSLPKMLPVTGA